MKLLGFSYVLGSGPARSAYVPLGELTAVIGANDVGKTRLVRTFARTLTEASGYGEVQALCFAELDVSAVAALLKTIGGTNLTAMEAPSRHSLLHIRVDRSPPSQMR